MKVFVFCYIFSWNWSSTILNVLPFIHFVSHLFFILKIQNKPVYLFDTFSLGRSRIAQTKCRFKYVQFNFKSQQMRWHLYEEACLLGHNTFFSGFFAVNIVRVLSGQVIRHNVQFTAKSPCFIVATNALNPYIYMPLPLSPGVLNSNDYCKESRFD